MGLPSPFLRGRRRRWWRRASRDQAGGGYCRPLATWWPLSHAARPPGAVGLPVGRGMTTARRIPASHALHCLRLPGRRTVTPVRRGIRCTAEWLAVSAELADLGAPAARLRTSDHGNEQMAARHCSWRGNSAMSPDAHLARSSRGICGDHPALPVSRPLASIRGRPDPCSTGSSDRRSDVKWLRRISGIIWIFTWRTIYLEIFRWHHMTKSLRFNPPPPPPGTDIRPRPGTPLIAVCAGAVAAPLVFVAATAVERVRGKSARTPARRTG